MPPGGQDKPANERLLAILTEEQVRRWKAMTGEPVKVRFAPFPPPANPGVEVVPGKWPWLSQRETGP
jgi:hypothetical protein